MGPSELLQNLPFYSVLRILRWLHLPLVASESDLPAEVSRLKYAKMDNAEIFTMLFAIINYIFLSFLFFFVPFDFVGSIPNRSFKPDCSAISF